MFGLLILSTFGCANVTKNLSSNDKINSVPEQPYLLIGVSPDFQMNLVDGVINKEGQFVFSRKGNAAAVRAEQGYIFVPLKKKEENSTHIGIWAILGGNLFDLYLPCANETDAFAIPGNGFYYLGDYAFTYGNKELRYQHTYDTDGAHNFIRSNFPNLSDTQLKIAERQQYTCVD